VKKTKGKEAMKKFFATIIAALAFVPSQAQIMLSPYIDSSIDGLTESELRTFLKAGESNISVTLSVSDPTGISRVQADGSSSRAYTLQGTVAQTGQKGIVIQQGKKIIK